MSVCNIQTMKIILAVALLLSITDNGYTFGRFFHRDWLNYPQFTPPGHLKHREHMHSQNSSPCPLLEQLFSFKVNQLKNDIGQTCTAAWICRDPVTGDTVVTDADGRYITINDHWQMNTRPNENRPQNNEQCQNSIETGSDTGYPDNSGNINNGRGDTSVTPTQVHSTQPQTTETPRTHGGEGLIDIRMGSV